MNLGEVIKEYRDSNSLTMDDFAKKSGISKGYISMLEKNINPKTKGPIVPSLKTFQMVAKAINMDFNELIKIVDLDQKISLELNSNSPEILTEDPLVQEIYKEIILLDDENKDFILRMIKKMKR